MPLTSFSDAKSELLTAARKVAARPGVLGSLLLHGLAALIIFLFIVKNASQTVLQAPLHIVPIDLIRLGEETVSPSAARKAVVPQEQAAHPQEAASPRRAAVSPTGKKQAPEDALDAKLRALARLRQPPTKLNLQGTGASNVEAASSGAQGNQATYSIRDYVRAQVERRWYYNFSKLGGRTVIVPIRIAMKRDGTIVSAEIVEEERAKHDVAYRDVALSARNAALLSSPIALPPGDYPKTMHMTLDMNPRDVLR
ncbi:MAG: cell envelope integrity protein TolA [Alphaproteobacteria bacterium]|nr:cell envelope integrity protein TolA [Alphaproteobacteria bacterium]MDE1985807.1 cell envelope integrity protein TolA [Alphaproteobacteria bacterium]MDE2163680.1 cell envelope integrity protein TolA [Alphaproteobacteria bacterium]MDE2264347.1 cell envelope integrity protein TolA [Alphaproteobacteria bacterium]MDE2499266.1 cell envelope integrity protein TolA [Alphaproteobacteria bacterium]